MSNIIFWNAQVSIQDGRLSDARELAGELVANTKEESGTVGYEWFLTPDGKICHIFERFVSSEAALIHLNNFGAKFGERFMSCFEVISLSVYGEPSADLKGVLDGMGAVYFDTLNGFSR